MFKSFFEAAPEVPRGAWEVTKSHYGVWHAKCGARELIWVPEGKNFDGTHVEGFWKEAKNYCVVMEDGTRREMTLLEYSRLMAWEP